MNIDKRDLHGLVVATAADRDALLRDAAARNVLPEVKTVDVSRFLPVTAEDALSAIMDRFSVDVHHADKLATFCPYAFEAPAATPKIAFLHQVAAFLASTGRLGVSGYRPDPASVTLLNDAPPIPVQGYEEVKRDLLDGVQKPSLELIESADGPTQVEAVVGRLVALLSAGVRPDDVRIVNATAHDVRKIARIAATYGFTVTDPASVPLVRLPLGAAFLAAVASASPARVLEAFAADPRHHNEADAAVLDAIQGILARYGGDLADRSLLAFECARTTVAPVRTSNVVRAVPADGFSALDSAYHLVMNFTDELFPAAAIDDDYLSDAEKTVLGLETSAAKNARIRETLARRAVTVAHAVFFRPRKIDGNATRPAELGDERVQIEIIEYDPDLHPLSAAFGILAYAKRRHDLIASGVAPAGYARLAARFEAGYSAYDPAFRPLSPAAAALLMRKRVVLSATSLETFNRCRFRFLCDHLLKLAPYEASDAQELGKLAHRALKAAFAENRSAAGTAAAEAAVIKTADARLGTLAELLAKRLELVEVRLRERSRDTVEFAHEREIEYALEPRPGFTVKGTVDRVLIFRRDGLNYVFVIDYKTGSPTFSKADFDKGTDIQPVFYLHLLERDGELSAFVPAGFYYQPVTVGRLVRSDQKDVLGDALKLDGLTLADRAVVNAAGGPAALRKVRVKDDGGFYAGSAVAASDELRAMLARIDGFIADAIDAIVAGAYFIDPEARRPGAASASCEYCRNRGVCYSVDLIPEADEPPAVAGDETEAD